MIESEVLRTPNNKGVGGLPRELQRRREGTPPRAPALWGTPDTFQGSGESEGVMGGYPRGFIAWAAPQLDARPRDLLHMCSGGLPVGVGRARVDLRPSMTPDVVADCRALPFASDSFRAVMIDPPYSEEYARDLYGTGYPRPSHLLKEAARVVEPSGRIGILHFFVPNPPHGCKLLGVRGVTFGCGYRIRAFTIYEKTQAELNFKEQAK